MKKAYDDDDGRTIADMSGVDRQSVFSGLFVGLRFGGDALRRGSNSSAGEGQREGDVSPSVRQTLERGERRGYIFGAMSAGLVIGLIILAVFAAAIVLILWIGHKL